MVSGYLYYLFNMNIGATRDIELGLKKPVELGMVCIKASFGILGKLYFKGYHIHILFLVICYLFFIAIKYRSWKPPSGIFYAV